MKTVYSFSLLLLAGYIGLAPAWAYSSKSNYISPEVAYGHLQRYITVPRFINLNTASLAELKALPGMTESLSLKLLRLRPLQGFKDLYRLPLEESKRIDRLIEHLEGYVTF